MLGNKFPHRFLYIFMMSVLAFGLSTGEILMSIPSIVLAANWLLEGKLKDKWLRIKSLNYAPIVFMLIYIIHLIWVIFTINKDEAIKDLVLKLPLFSFPLVFGSSLHLSNKEWWIVIASFITGLLVSCTAGFIRFYSLDFIDNRELSIFISHIRLSLLIGMGVLFLLIALIYFEDKRKYLLILPILYLMFFIRILESGTGYLSLAIGIYIFLLYYVINAKKKKLKILLFAFTILGVITSTVGVFLAYNSLTVINDSADKSKLEEKTIHGEFYYHDTLSNLTENGFYVDIYYCPKEVASAWSTLSSIPYDSLDSKGQPIKTTLMRYVSSKGLRKDLEGMAKLSAEDITNIENGMVTHLPRKYGITARIKEVLYEIISYKEHANPNGHSVIQRMYYLDAGLHLFANNILIGVSKGDEMNAYHQYYSSIESKLVPEYQLRAHNQLLSFFVCFGILGGLFVLIGLIYPFTKTKFHFLTIAFIVFGLLSFFTDDVFETQAGVTFFSFFYCFILFQTKREFYYKSISS